jgi:hypothetical protein
MQMNDRMIRLIMIVHNVRIYTVLIGMTEGVCCP